MKLNKNSGALGLVVALGVVVACALSACGNDEATNYNPSLSIAVLDDRGQSNTSLHALAVNADCENGEHLMGTTEAGVLTWDYTQNGLDAGACTVTLAIVPPEECTGEGEARTCNPLPILWVLPFERTSVNVLDNGPTALEIRMRPATPPHPAHPCDPLGDCDDNGTPDVVQPGESHDPAEPFGTITVRVRRDSADGELLNGLTVMVGSVTLVTGPAAEGEEGGFAPGVVVFTGLSLVTPHTVVVVDPEGNLGSQTAAVAFADGQTTVTHPVVLVPADDRWGNGITPELVVGDVFGISWTPCLDGVCGWDGVTCTVTDSAEEADVLTLAEDCRSVTAVNAGSATVTARRGTHTAALAFTVVPGP